MIVVSDSGPIIALSKINQLSILKHHFGAIHISEATYYELVKKGKGRFGSKEVENADWIKVAKVKDDVPVKVLELELDRGEAETIILGNELKADLILLDETIARRVARLLNLKVKGTVGILVLAKKEGIIKKLKPILNELRTKGVWISDEVYDEALKLADEK